MGYGDDACIERFTVEQAARAVCSLVNYRAQLFELSPTDAPEYIPVGLPIWLLYEATK